MHYADRLNHRITQTSPVCVGLDPALTKLPEGIARDAKGVKEFCIGIIDSTHDLVSCVKPQLAYFEVLGWEGMKVFFEVCEYAKTKGLMVIADGKRNDIGPTCEAYAEAYLGAGTPIDALTVSPYLGTDGINPFITQAVKNEKGIYVLVKTSNPSSGDIQDLPVGDEALHEHVAQLVEALALQHLGENALSCVGAVVGATYPEELKYLRSLMPNVPFLLPGYGTQGGSAEDSVYGFLADGIGAVVSASRSILFASSGKDWREAARREAEKMAEEIRKVVSQ
jgi:orotidine-5'-phosphate decarboxylase